MSEFRYNRGMELNDTLCYQALLAHDARFDGAFFVGVVTTGIYCRTVCTARTPRPENCTFYPSAAAAERAGFRPCLRCRPELAPGNARVDAVGRLASVAASRIEEGILSDLSVEALAAEIGITDRHLRRVVQEAFGVSPVELAQTQRLLLAKRLLTDTDLPVTRIAFASGFASVRRFNALFKERYRLTPTDLRKGEERGEPQPTLVCELAYRPPLDWPALLGFLGSHSSRGVEAVEGNCYLRTVEIGKQQGWIVVTPSQQKATLRVELSASLALALQPVLARVKRLFDLSAEPNQIARHLGSLADAHPGLRVPGAFDGFEIAIRTILGQQISVRAATTLAGRFVAAFGEPIQTSSPQLTHLWPRPERIAGLEPQALLPLGILASRSRTIITLARVITNGSLSLEPTIDPQHTIAQLTALPGIGEWTAQYIAMRALAWPDAFPHTDLALMRALGETRRSTMLERAEVWRPWRSYATMHLWKSLEKT